ncbi:hypothetical protein [Streptomyces silvisoli]|uniref:Uncharacterized protein n=1 Tax=Streptomyces silvisoli TaxID=3034235 RepID=A0ABT5ZS56_9ACTN|nr:hypothetical protein [Streptomyces silvisoli]MDF3292359.1 hypothetical protein [Streptomyces silvisoli]
MPKKKRKKKPLSRARRTGVVPTQGQLPSTINLGGPRVPSRGWGFQALIDDLREAGLPPLEFTAYVPEGCSSDFSPQIDAPRAPLQAGWYLQSNLVVPVYNWVFSEQQLSEDPSGLDLRRRGFALYVAHSACTHGKADCGYASAEVMETWTPIVAPDPSIVAADRYGGHAPGYSTQVAGRLPEGAPRTVGVLDVDYARVAGRSLPERWDIDVVGLLVMEWQEAVGVPGQAIWRQRAFRTFRDHNLSELNAAAEDVDLIIGHNLFDGDYRCLRTYGDLVNVGALAAKTVDTLYAARHLSAGDTARLDLTTLARAQGLRERAKKASRTEAHRGIRTIDDAEERWFFQPVSDDCEVMLELWLGLITSRRLRTVLRSGEAVEYAVGDEDLRLLLEPQLAPDTFTNLLTTKGTVYPLPGAARNESVARIHREIEQRRADGAAVNGHPTAAHRQRCLAPGDEAGRQCDQLIPATETYCRTHRSKRRCRGNPALDDTCTTVVHDDLAHCHWHRMTALYVPQGQRIVEDFSLPLPLHGWARGSDWGYDTGTRSFFARLYRNDDDPSGAPTIWLSGSQPDLTDVVALTHALQEATGMARREVVDALTADRKSPQQRAVATQDWEPAPCASLCPCGTSDCGHGEPCPNDECTGHDIHTMRNPSSEGDVTAWQDYFDCCEGCGASVLDISLPERPWGEVEADGTVTVYAGVSHYELGVYS